MEDVVAPPCHAINNDLSPVAKGKRTKRQRPHSPIPFTIINHRRSPSSADDSTTTEEEDTAKCLILLSQGYFHSQSTKPQPETSVRGGGACMYACKTCDRVFSSFQALGGHRTSHKKTKNEKRSFLVYDADEDYPSPPSKKRIAPPSLSLQLSSTSTVFAAVKQSPSPRIHECSYCGAGFTSGQALGGHMRRHRAGPISPAAGGPMPKKPRISGLSLDLNFPAPEDENNQILGFGQQRGPEKLGLPTTTPTLVDCHF